MIVYFSGTGNTRHVAEELARLLGDDARGLTADELRHPADAVLDTADGRVVWAFPVYSWGPPPVVEDYINKVKATPAAAAAVHHMVATCGDDTGYTDRRWRRLMERRGWRTGAAFSVQMPNTYVCMKGFDVDAPALAAAKVAAAPERLRKIAAVIGGEGDDALPEGERMVRGSWPWVKSAVVRPWFRRYAMSPRPFGTNGGCTGCGLCARSCPMANISMAGAEGEQRPQWGAACALCLRCYHLCPRHAVTYGRATDGKGQYHF